MGGWSGIAGWAAGWGWLCCYPCPIWWLDGCARRLAHWAVHWGGKFIFGKDVLHTNLGCFYVTAGAGAGGRALVNMTQKSGMPN